MKPQKFISYAPYNNFSYTQLSFVFVLQEDSCFDHDDIDACFLDNLQKDFGIFHVLHLETFLSLFNNIYLLVLYICKKVIKNIFYKLQKLSFKMRVTYVIGLLELFFTIFLKNHLNCFKYNMFCFHNFSENVPE